MHHVVHDPCQPWHAGGWGRQFLFGGSFVFCGDFLVISPPPHPPEKRGGGEVPLIPPPIFSMNLQGLFSAHPLHPSWF